jgi:hypothetical protein
MDRNQFQVPTIWSQLGYVLPWMRKMIDAWHIHVTCSFYFQLFQGGKRSDGRTPEGIRPIDSSCGLLPRAHGSALFTRGETQVRLSVFCCQKHPEAHLIVCFF